VRDWCRQNRHLPTEEQHRVISRKLRGHYAYYGITGNSLGLRRFQDVVVWNWKLWLSRRRRGGWHS
jgi:hypothetical protein